MTDECGSFFNRHKWFYHDDFHRECIKCGERQFINYGDGIPTWRNIEHYRVSWRFSRLSEVNPE